MRSPNAPILIKIKITAIAILKEAEIPTTSDVETLDITSQKAYPTRRENVLSM